MDWIFKQNSSLATKAKVMLGCIAANLPGFSVSQKWLPYTPGLNPWIYLFSQFWRQGSLLNNPKVFFYLCSIKKNSSNRF